MATVTMKARAAMKTTFRASADDLAEIDRRAGELGLSRTRYLITLGTGRDLPLSNAEGLTSRLETLEKQMSYARRSLGLLGLGGDDEGAV